MKFSVKSVVRQIPCSILFFVLGCTSGAFLSSFLFLVDKQLLAQILNLWSKRILFGLEIFQENYTFWFLLNNSIALIVISLASVLIAIYIFRTPTFLVSKKFRNVEKHRPKITLIGLYMVPILAPFLNGFFNTLFVFYILLAYGFKNLQTVLFLILPHGISEIIALLLASSLGLAYLKILKPLILKKKWKKCIKIGKKLVKTKTTVFFITLILILAILGSSVEGLIALLL